MRDLPQHYRDDTGLMERTCPHGIGHPDPDGAGSPGYIGEHGCDGCCTWEARAKRESQAHTFIDKDKTMGLTMRQLAAVRAALTFFARQFNENGDPPIAVHDLAGDSGTVEPLTADEVLELADTLNAGSKLTLED
jgi:hypothetical protein